MKSSLISFHRTYLVYLTDQGFKTEIAYFPYKNIYSVNIHLYETLDGSPLKTYKWSEVEDEIIQMIQYLKTQNYNVVDNTIDIRCWRETFRPTVEEIETLTLNEDIINIKIKLAAPTYYVK